MSNGPSLAAKLGALRVKVLGAEVSVSEVAVPHYEGRRPTSVLRLRGPEGSLGLGEHVGWSHATHEAFAACVQRLSWPDEATVETLALRPELAHDVPQEECRYRRAALDGALIDLALRQAGCSLSQLAQCSAVVAMRYVLSFEATRAPAERVKAIVALNPSTRFKIDVHPAWTEEEIQALALQSEVEILDGKGRGDRALWERVRRFFPHTLIEDAPGEPSSPRALDQPLLTLDQVQEALDGSAAINVKAPRMGGFRIALAALERAQASRRLAYVGGMFEVGVGRTQARCLAALCSPTAPNDLSPLGLDAARDILPPSPLTVRLDQVGFGT